jgi:hypothetical protein
VHRVLSTRSWKQRRDIVRIRVQAVELFVQVPDAERRGIGGMQMRWPESDIDAGGLDAPLRRVRVEIRRGVKGPEQTVATRRESTCVRHTIDRKFAASVRDAR